MSVQPSKGAIPAPLYPGVVKRPKIQPVFGPSSDCVTFGAGSAPPLPSDLKKRVQVYKPDTISAPFRKSANKGLAQAWKSFPRNLRRDLLTNGLQISLAPQLTDIELPVKDLLKQTKIQQELAKFRTKFNSDPDAVSGLVEALNLFLPAHPHTQYLRNLSKAHPDKPALNDLSDEDLFKASLLLTLALGNGPVYLDGSGIIGVPERASGIFSSWDKADKTPHTFSRVFRHEIFHLIDDRLGNRKTGDDYSAAPPFRKRLLQDRKQAIEKKLWPKAGEKVPDGPLAGTGATMDHYFNPDLDSEDQVAHDKAFSEAFAEIGAAITGGGAVNPKLVRKIYPSASAWVEKNILQPPPLHRQILDSIRETLRSWLAKIKNFFTSKFSSTNRQANASAA